MLAISQFLIDFNSRYDKLGIMTKDFDKWNTVKKGVDRNGLPKLYHTREIWWCSLGVNIGFEQNGGG